MRPLVKEFLGAFIHSLIKPSARCCGVCRRAVTKIQFWPYVHKNNFVDLGYICGFSGCMYFIITLFAKCTFALIEGARRIFSDKWYQNLYNKENNFNVKYIYIDYYMLRA